MTSMLLGQLDVSSSVLRWVAEQDSARCFIVWGKQPGSLSSASFKVLIQLHCSRSGQTFDQILLTV